MIDYEKTEGIKIKTVSVSQQSVWYYSGSLLYRSNKIWQRCLRLDLEWSTKKKMSVFKLRLRALLWRVRPVDSSLFFSGTKKLNLEDKKKCFVIKVAYVQHV